MKKRKLVREQLESTLQSFSPLARISAPHKGWIRAVRDALGMTAKQLACRMGVSQQSVARIEKAESAGSVTIRTMQRLAECLDCSLVYGLVPHSTLDTTLRRQAHAIATRRLTQVNHTMALEAQSLSTNENKRVLSEMVDDLVDTVPSDLWNES